MGDTSGSGGCPPRSASMVAVSDFGPFDMLADWAHSAYLDGNSLGAVQVCREALQVTLGSGDRRTTRFLCYIQAIALMELGRHREAVTVALDLLEDLEGDTDPLWRAKALAVLAESSASVNELNRAMDALAEAVWLVESSAGCSYNYLSASMAVALALRAVYLFEHADDRLHVVDSTCPAPVALVLCQEAALLRAFWGTTLELAGHRDDAGQHFVISAQRALRMGRIAAAVGNGEMAARAVIIEAYATLRLGSSDLAASRVRAATHRLALRGELVEAQLAQLVLAEQATAAGAYGVARPLLMAASAAAGRAGRDVFSAFAAGALADLAVTQQGRHPAVAVWKRIARDTMARLWAEREGRFVALQDRNRLRELAAESDRRGQVALEDPLTGLGNRRMLVSTLQQDRAGLTALFVDVDSFKQVNDRFSHAVGDEVLRRVALLLLGHCGTDDVVIRYGGDEFVVLLSAGADPAELAHRVIEAVRQHDWHRISDRLDVAVSIGAASAASAREALACADQALYAAKRAGGDRVVCG